MVDRTSLECLALRLCYTADFGHFLLNFHDLIDLKVRYLPKKHEHVPYLQWRVSSVSPAL